MDNSYHKTKPKVLFVTGEAEDDLRRSKRVVLKSQNIILAVIIILYSNKTLLGRITYTYRVFHDFRA
jgi:hypothetical protein